MASVSKLDGDGENFFALRLYQKSNAESEPGGVGFLAHQLSAEIQLLVS